MNHRELIEQLRHSGQFTLSDTGRERLQRVLLKEFDYLASEPVPVSVARGHRLVFASTLVAGALLSLLGMGAIANAAKPGDALFGLDQAVEQVELHLMVSETAKARVEARIAEERLAEQRELEDRHSNHTPAAEKEATKALDQALERVDEAQKKLEDRPGAASESLQKTAEHLKELQQQHEERRGRSGAGVPDDDRQTGKNINRVTDNPENESASNLETEDRQNEVDDRQGETTNASVNRNEREDGHEEESDR